VFFSGAEKQMPVLIKGIDSSPFPPQPLLQQSVDVCCTFGIYDRIGRKLNLHARILYSYGEIDILCHAVFGKPAGFFENGSSVCRGRPADNINGIDKWVQLFQIERKKVFEELYNTKQ
jgi:hypothetical protein